MSHHHWHGGFLLLAGLRDIDTPDRRRAISLTVHGLKHGFNPSPEALFRLRYLLAIHPRRQVLRNLSQILPHSFPCDVMRQRSKPELWLTPSFRCYPFKSCCHGWRFFSLHRRPNPPVVWSPCCPRTVQLPLAASPCGRLSRPRSTTSQSDFRQVFGSSSPCRLVGPYKLRLNLTDFPCSHGNLRQHAGVRTPEASQDTRLCASWDSVFPFERQGRLFNHDRFRGYVSVHSRSGLRPPCLRFAMSVAGHHAELGARLLARLCRGHHLR